MRLYARKLDTSQHLTSLDLGVLVEHGFDPPNAYYMMTIAITNGIRNQSMSHALVNNGLISGVVTSSYQQAKSA